MVGRPWGQVGWRRRRSSSIVEVPPAQDVIGFYRDGTVLATVSSASRSRLMRGGFIKFIGWTEAVGDSAAPGGWASMIKRGHAPRPRTPFFGANLRGGCVLGVHGLWKQKF